MMPNKTVGLKIRDLDTFYPRNINLNLILSFLQTEHKLNLTA